MYINGAYNDITNLMTLLGNNTEESEKTSGTSKGSAQAAADGAESGGDLVELSALGGLSNLAQGLSANKTVLESLNERIETLQGHFLSALTTKLEEAGVDVEQKITLTRDDDGTVSVAGEHPDKEAIERIFKDEPVLAEAFSAIADESELVRTIKSRKNTGYGQGGLAAYLNTIGTDSEDSFFFSMMSGSASTYFS